MTDRTSARAMRSFISGDFFTPAYRITGKIAVGNTGLIGLLNDPTSSLAEIGEVYMSRVNQPGKIVARFNIARIAKVRLELILLSRREDAGPLALTRGGFAKVVQHPVLISTPAFEVTGMLEQPGRLDVPSLLMEGSGKFFLVHQAKILVSAAPQNEFTAASVLINRTQIDLFCGQEEVA
ncbi:MAG: hypothetical protein HY023_07400 [Chloroflexi bacterium]|nr:hypothetical protein [Chloroflexota bacterium]MBI3760696.1 hypothetical protein [Chloroflexota bacterium]